jgi:DNA-directed RNA polymerase alpha subunit
MQRDLLSKPLSELQLTEHLREAVKNSDFKTLGEILEYDADILVKEKKFNLHAITELITFLEAHGLSSLFRD